jgi:hypothetical protein
LDVTTACSILEGQGLMSNHLNWIVNRFPTFQRILYVAEANVGARARYEHNGWVVIPSEQLPAEYLFFHPPAGDAHAYLCLRR